MDCSSLISQTHSIIVGLFAFRQFQAIIVLAAIIIWRKISALMVFIDPGIIDNIEILISDCISDFDIFR